PPLPEIGPAMTRKKTNSAAKNSTNIRLFISFVFQRSLIRTGFSLAPARAAKRAARLFLTPLRRPGPDRTRYVSRNTPFAVDAPSGPVAAWLYGRTENPRGETVLLVHGWEDDHLSWAPLADRLVRDGYRVLALDLPGHGRSPGKIAPIPV